MSLLKTLILSSTIVLQGSALFAVDEKTHRSAKRFVLSEIEEIEDFPESSVSSPSKKKEDELEEIDSFSEEEKEQIINTNHESDIIISSSDEENKPANSIQDQTIIISSQEQEIISSQEQESKYNHHTVFSFRQIETPTDDLDQVIIISSPESETRINSDESNPLGSSQERPVNKGKNIRDRFILNNNKPTPFIKKKRPFKKK